MFKVIHVYILRCSDDSYYIGITNNLALRIEQHNSGQVPNSYTSTRLPVELIYSEQYTDPKVAIAREKQLKRWSRKKKEALMWANYELLRQLAACKNDTSHLNFAFGKVFIQK